MVCGGVQKRRIKLRVKLPELFLSMALKVLLVDTDEQVCVDTGIELGYDFEMLYISTAEDSPIFDNTKYHKRIQNRLIVQDENGKLIIDDSDESEGVYDCPEGE